MSEGRSRRAPTAKLLKKQETLERLRKAREEGKNSYAIEEEKDVYEEVDEDTYAQLVSKRQREDWIVDDADGSYAEHGREIFDDDFDDGQDDAHDQSNSRKSCNNRNKYSLKSKLSSSLVAQEKPKKNDIRSMFPSHLKVAPIIKNNGKKSMDEVMINDDEIDGIVETITINKTSTPTLLSTSSSAFTPIQLKKRIATPGSSKRKTPSMSRNPFSVPPLKKRASNLEFNFDEIIDQNEMIPTLMDKHNPDEPIVLKHNEPVEEYEEFDTFDINDDDAEIPVVEVISQTETPDYSAEDLDCHKTLRMFWFDAFLDTNHLTSTVYLFGRAHIDGKLVTCSLAVTDLDRRVYLLPRERFQDDRCRKVTMDDVLEEFTKRLKKRLKPAQCLSRVVSKRYAFELDFVPDVGDYLEVRYPASSPPLPSDLMSGNTYRYAFGVNTSILENLILDAKLKGPCWIEIDAPRRHEPPNTWCKLELAIDSPSKIRVLPDDGNLPPSPNFTLLSLVLKNYVDPDKKTNEVVAISCLVNRSYNFDVPTNQSKRYDQHFCLVSEPSSKTINIPADFTHKMALKDYNKTSIQRANNERELLNLFLAKFAQIDADIIVGHDIYDHDYDLLLDRYGHYKNTSLWSKLGRMRRSVAPKRKDKAALAGRLVCDVRRLAQELIKSDSYDLSTLAAQVLKKNRFAIGHDILPKFYESSSQLIKMIQFTMKDNEMVLDIVHKINCLPLVRQISNVVGNLLSRTMLYGRAERNEYLLLHAFVEKGFIVPDKADRYSANNAKASLKIDNYQAGKEEEQAEEEEGKANSKKNKASTSYVGGLVLEPKVGYYDRFILLMDFNSLYPSIIQEYNICFTTIRGGDADRVDELVTQLGDTAGKDGEMGVLPAQIKRLVESRRAVKKTMLDQSISAEMRMQLDIKQLALKITANSMYGCLGFSHSRFYAKHLAALVTYKGRDILMQTKALVEKMGFEVIYGDTDSIMILTTCTDIDEVYQTGWKIQKQVNRMYNLLEIDIDGVFRSMLLLKKKKYAAMVMERTGEAGQYKLKQEVKGLDIVRRDWSVISKESGKQIIDIILEQPEQSIAAKVDAIHKFLHKLSNEIRSGELGLEKFVITKSLTKRPEDYAENSKALTHVAVAKRYNQLGLGKPLRAGDTVPYVICKDGTTNAPTQRGYHLEEIRKSPETLSVDIDYYCSQQLLPVISRLCDPIDGTDAGTIAEFLGVKNHRAGGSRAAAMAEDDPGLNLGEHKFDCCQALMLQCPYAECGKTIEIRDIFAQLNLKTTDQRKKVLADLKEKSKTENEDKPEKKNVETHFWKLTLDECAHCGKAFDPLLTAPWFVLQMIKNLKFHLNRYYKLVVVCDDYTCDYKTRYLTGDHNGKRLECPKCQGNLLLTLSDHQLHQQLYFFVDMFDFKAKLARFNSLDLNDKQKSIRNSLEQKVAANGLYERMHNTAQRYLHCSAYDQVDLASLFRQLR